jgi:hypothetical protein
MSTNFAGYIENKGCYASLEIGKLQEIVAGSAAEEMGVIRVAEQDGQDYFFEPKIFSPLVLPPELFPPCVRTGGGQF